MALFAIPNPKKSTQVDFPIERVKLSVKNISLVNSKYNFKSSNEIFNQYTYEALEFLSLGVFIDINLNSISENKTEITVEIRRKIGSFDQSHEINKANEHLFKIFDCIAKLTIKSPEEIEKLKNANVPTKALTPNAKGEQGVSSNAWYEKSWLAILLCIIFFPVGFYALWKNSTIKKGWKIAITTIIVLIVLTNDGLKSKLLSSNTSEKGTDVTLTQTQKDSIKIAEIIAIKGNTISAKYLTSSYEANEVNADNNYKGKTIYVNGIIKAIKKDVIDEVYVTLKGDKMFMDVQCFFNDKETALKLQKGMKVTFKGECDGLLINVLMKKCELVNLK